LRGGDAEGSDRGLVIHLDQRTVTCDLFQVGRMFIQQHTLHTNEQSSLIDVSNSKLDKSLFNEFLKVSSTTVS